MAQTKLSSSNIDVSSTARPERTVNNPAHTLREAARVLNIDVHEGTCGATGQTGTELAKAIIDAVKQRVKARQAIVPRPPLTDAPADPAIPSSVTEALPPASHGQHHPGPPTELQLHTAASTGLERDPAGPSSASATQGSSDGDAPDLQPASVPVAPTTGTGSVSLSGPLQPYSPPQPSQNMAASFTHTLARAAQALAHRSHIENDTAVALGAQAIVDGIRVAEQAGSDGRVGSHLTLGTRCMQSLAARLAEDAQKEGACDDTTTERWMGKAALYVAKAAACLARTNAKGDPACARAAIAVHAAATREANKPRQAPTPSRALSTSRVLTVDGQQAVVEQQARPVPYTSPPPAQTLGRGRRSSITEQVIHMAGQIQADSHTGSGGRRGRAVPRTVSEGVQTEELYMNTEVHAEVNEDVGLRLLGSTGRGETALMVSPMRATAALAAVAASGQLVSLAPPPPPPPSSTAPTALPVPLSMTRVRLELPRLSPSPSRKDVRQVGSGSSSAAGPFTLEISEDVFAALVAQAAQKVVEEQAAHSHERPSSSSGSTLRKSVSFADMTDFLRGMSRDSAKVDGEGKTNVSPSARASPRAAPAPFASPVLTQKGRSILADDGDEEEAALQARRHELLAARQAQGKQLVASPTGSTASSTRQSQRTTVQHASQPRSEQPSGSSKAGRRLPVPVSVPPPGRAGSVQSKRQKVEKSPSPDKPRPGVYYQPRAINAAAPVPVRAAAVSVLPGHDARSLVRARMLKAQAVKSKEYELLKKPVATLPLPPRPGPDMSSSMSSSMISSIIPARAPLTASSLASDEDAIQALGATLDGLLKKRGKREEASQQAPRLALLPLGVQTGRNLAPPSTSAVVPTPVQSQGQAQAAFIMSRRPSAGMNGHRRPSLAATSMGLDEATDAALAKINSLLGPPPALKL